jgi:hypothetical protein
MFWNCHSAYGYNGIGNPIAGLNRDLFPIPSLCTYPIAAYIYPGRNGFSNPDTNLNG